MAEEQSGTVGRLRARGSKQTPRGEALERLRALKQSGARRAESNQVKIEQPIYDKVDEDEYEALVAKRREEFGSFIVDDDGLGYGDVGQEVDWSLAADEENPGKLKRKKENAEKKDFKLTKKPSALAAAAAIMGKQKISTLLTSSIFNKNRENDHSKNLSCDSIVNDVIAEFAPDEADREKRRRDNSILLSKNCPKTFVPSINSNIIPVKIKKKSAVNSISYSSTIGNENGVVSASNPEAMSNDLLVGDEVEEIGEVMEFDDRNSTNDEAVELNEQKPSDDVILKDSRENLVATEVKKGEVFALNAKIENRNDPAFSATAGWQAVSIASNTDMNSDGPGGADIFDSEERTDLNQNEDGSLPFYIIDAYEEYYGTNAGNIYLFGKIIMVLISKLDHRWLTSVFVIKVKTGGAGGKFHSCCVIVKNMQRCVYAIPRGHVFDNSSLIQLDRDSEESPASFQAQLHEMASGLKTEISKQLLERDVSSFSMVPVKRSYAFDRSDVPLGENYVLKINYPFKDPPLPADLKGENFCALLGTHCSALELFLIKRKIKGPSWLLISKPSICPVAQRVSWCKFEVAIECPKDIRVSSSSKSVPDIPPVVVTAINLKTTINEKKNINEIVSASVVCCHRAKIDIPMLATEWTQLGVLSHFTVVRKIDGGIFPMGFTKEVADRNSKAGTNVVISESSERALLNRLMLELHKLDTDVLVGHNISGFDLDILLHRVQACSVPSTTWSKIGRLKRSVMPKLTKGSSIFGSGATPGILACVAGRLLCDTFLCSRDLLKEVSYSLTELSKSQLKKDRKEISPHDIPRMFQSCELLMELIEYGETDAWLSMELMFHLSVLPLTRQLTNISGNLWGKTLQGGRAQRVEYLLLHAFHAKKYIVPDKFSSKTKETKLSKRKSTHGAEGKEGNDLEISDTNNEAELLDSDHVKSRKGPSYSGGLVLEPKRGLYDKYILLLDFNSLYPSIIQEYNICFTTVERSADGMIPRLPSNKTVGVLPELLKKLVERRRRVKSMLKKAKGLKIQQFDITQQALKLTANSMYGCLGFPNSRFYAKPLAELITLQGREILQSTVDLVQNTLNLEVIYGDTDSIMIYSGLDDIGNAKAIATKVIEEVNQKYRCLEIDLDGFYKRMLLLKKKKYAAVKLQFRDGVTYEVIERKGLDMVRRDWSMLAKEVGDFCLSQILSGSSCEAVVESIHNSLMKVQEDMRNGQIELEKYIITKSLTKPPEAYPDAKSQPHVEVALRLKRNGYVSGCSAGDTVPYIICCEQATSSVTTGGIAQRARHPEELKRDNENWIIDINYYLAQQIHPVVSRLCASIEGTSPARLADCLGLDSSKFQSKSGEAIMHDPSTSLLYTTDDEERYRGCEPLVLSCPGCSATHECPPIYPSVVQILTDTEGRMTRNIWLKLHCFRCPEEGVVGKFSAASIGNQVKSQADQFVATYYRGLMICDDETCNYATRSLNLRVVGDSDRGTVCPNYPQCNGRLLRKYTEADLYKQLSYFCHILDTVRCIDKVEVNMRAPVVKELLRVRPLVELAASTVQKMRDRCAYGWVQLKDLTITI
ncbi:DNA metabolism protein [Lithospermum erythrorhizon]|uniref:DNA polymerase n=1 Tax=Lithospermum erythrorhizon TaxID=34254 RepID=A0AAV3R418_LITER